MLETSQAVVFHTHRLAFDFTRAVATLVDQNPEDFAAADLCQVANLAGRNMLLGPRQPGIGRWGQGQADKQRYQQ